VNERSPLSPPASAFAHGQIKKERVSLVGTDQQITSEKGLAATLSWRNAAMLCHRQGLREHRRCHRGPGAKTAIKGPDT
jgi:hypothetical protein